MATGFAFVATSFLAAGFLAPAAFFFLGAFFVGATAVFLGTAEGNEAPSGAAAEGETPEAGLQIRGP